jgi:hypothetical protein
MSMAQFHYFPDRQQVRHLPAEIRELATLADEVADCVLASGSVEPVEDLVHALYHCALGTEVAIYGLLERLEAKEAAAAQHAKRIEQMQRSHEKRMEQALANVVAAAIDESAEFLDPKNYDGYFVYILWGDDPNVPLYVGQSRSLLGRIANHMGDKTKRKLTRRIQLLRFATHNDMDAAERRLIRHYKPPMNKAGIPTDAAVA